MSRGTGSPLGITGLPAPIGNLAAGELYALSLGNEALSLALLLGLVRASLAAKRQLAVICEDAAALSAQIEKQGIEVHRLHQRRSLRFYTLAAVENLMRRVGPAQLLDEIDHFGIGADSLVVVVPADGVFAWGPEALARFAYVYHGWTRVQDASLLFVFSTGELPVGRAESLATAATGMVAGLAHIHQKDGDWIWETRHWHRIEGLANQVRPLQLAADGSLVVTPDPSAEFETWARTAASAADRERVFATEAAVEGQQAWPASWTIAADAQHLEDLAASAVAATCVFDATDLQHFQALARRIHRLRRRSGRALKIFVRERGVRLRYGQTHVLLALGANGIWHEELRRSALVDQVTASSGRLYIGAIPADFDTAFAAAMPPLLSGYLPVPNFIDALRRSIDRARACGLQCVLVRCFFSADTPPIEALHSCRPVRPGDLYTADAESLYLFLDACSVDDIEVAMERIMRRPLAQWSSGQLRVVSNDSMIAELNALARRHIEQHFEDYSAQLKQVPLSPRETVPASVTITSRQITRSVSPAPLAMQPSYGEIR